MPELKTFVALLFFAPYLSARLDFPSPHYLSLGLEDATVLDWILLLLAQMSAWNVIGHTWVGYTGAWAL